MSRDIWVYAEKLDMNLAPVYKELVSKANEMKQYMDGAKVYGVLLGKDVSKYVSMASENVDGVYVIEHEKLDTYDAGMLGTAFAELIKHYEPEVILVGATALGSELAPLVAGKLKTGVAAHCVDIVVTEERINFMVPAFGGRFVSEIYVPEKRPIMASVRPGIFTAEEKKESKEAEQVNSFDSSFLDNVVSSVQMISFEEDAPSTDIKLEDADIVVCAGRGVSKEEDFNNILLLAEKLGAAFGYTRSFVDLGFVPDESKMIGTSGKSIKPQLFLGFGISGAAHFTCGMNKSKYVISVNKDEKARMFSDSDLGVVNDAGKVIKAVIDKL